MLQTDVALPVMLGKFHMKRDAEGGKWGTATLTIKVGDDFELLAPLEEGRRLMKSNTAFDELSIESKMEGVQLEFLNGAGKGPKTVLEPKELFGFVFRRESSTQAGTLKKDRGTGVDLDFKFTVPLAASGAWAIENLGNMLELTIFDVQAELPLAPGGDVNPPGDLDNPDSQASRNKRVVEAEAEDPPIDLSEQLGMSMDRPTESVGEAVPEGAKKSVKGRKKKAKK